MARLENVVILGGGLAGLACAHELTKRGCRVVVVEKNGWVGGLASTIVKDGFRFDTGPHRWYTKHEEINRWLSELLRDELITIPRLTRIYYMGKMFHYPLRLRDVLRLGIAPSFRILRDFLLPTARKPVSADRSLEEAFVEQFGRTLYESFFREYSEKLWGRPCTDLSADWAFQRTRGLNLGKVLKQALLRRRTARSLATAFTYPKLGVGRIAERLAEEARSGGSEVQLDTEVLMLHHRDGRLSRIEAVHQGRPIHLPAETVVSTIPIADLVRRLEPPAPLNVLEAAGRLKFRDQIQVTFLLNGSIELPDNWIYVQDKTIPFTRFTIANNWSSSLSPDGKTSIVFEIPCDEGDPVWEESDEVLLQRTWDHLLKHFGWAVKAEIVGTHVYRVEKEYPVFERGYRLQLDAIKLYLGGFSNLHVIGRNGTFQYNNMDHSIMMGLKAARRLLGGQVHAGSMEAANLGDDYLEEMSE